MYKYIQSNAAIIRMNRGDSFKSPLFINDGTYMKPVRHQIQDDEVVYFGIMEPGCLWEQSIVMQTYDKNSEKTEDGDIFIKLNPEDTEYLYPGTYYYMIKLAKYKDNEVIYNKTVVPSTICEIL